MYPIALGLVIRSNGLWAEINSALRELPFRVVLDHPDISDHAGLLDRIERMVPDVLLIEFTGQAEALEKLVPQIKATAAAPVVLALETSRAVDVEDVVAAFGAGVDLALFPPFKDKLLKALERAQQRVRQRPSGKIFGFLSAKGGCGATTIACHTAAAIAHGAERSNKRTLLVDLDLNTGMVRFLMRSENPYSVLDAVSNLQRLDYDYWGKLVSSRIPGLEVIAAPVDLTSKHQLNREQIQHVLSFARTHYEWTILDLGRGLGLLAKSVLREIDELCLVTMHEIPAMHLTKKIIEVLRADGYPQERVRLIGNRLPRKGDASFAEMGELIGVPMFAYLSNDYQALYQAYSKGELLSRRSRLGQEFERLAGQMLGAKAPAVEDRFSLLDWVWNLGLLNGAGKGSGRKASALSEPGAAT